MAFGGYPAKLMLTLLRRAEEKTMPRGRVENLKPWKPGQSGNPGGRPKKDLASLIAQEIFSDSPEEIKAGLAKALRRGDAAVFKALADRGFGRLPQPLAVSGDPGPPVRIVFSGPRPSWLK
jgi:hypothetical protein